MAIKYESPREVEKRKAVDPVVIKRKRGRPLDSEKHLTIEAQKPWVSLGMSRRTWYKRKKTGE